MSHPDDRAPEADPSDLTRPDLDREMAAERGHFMKQAVDLELGGKKKEAADVLDDLPASDGEGSRR